MNFINNLKVGARLVAGFGALTLIMLLLGISATSGIQELSETMKNFGMNRVPSLQALAQLNRLRMVVRSQTFWVLAYETQSDLLEALRHVQEERRQTWRRVDEQWEKLLSIPRTSEKGRMLQQQLQGEYQAWRRHYVELDDLIDRIAAAGTESRQALYADYRQAIKRMIPASDQMGQTFDVMTDNNTSRTNQMIKDGLDLVSVLDFWVSAAIILSIFLAILLSWLITRSIAVPIRRGRELLSVIAEGDLSVEVPAVLTARGDEIGDLARAMRDMSAQLREMVQKVAQSADQVGSTAAEIAQSSADLAYRTEEQASALEKTAAAMEELTGAVKQSADNAGHADRLAEAANSQAEQGGRVVSEAITAMAAISAGSMKIAGIIGVIDEIAFQTNLLALNAAVEAARAGEQGRGFAVVAGEVRKLAQRSADAAKEIKSLITDSVHKIENGGRLVEHSGKTLHEIVASVQKVSDLVADMAAAAREQTAGIEQVNQAILSIDQVTQQNAALVEEAAAAGQVMGDQARELRNLMGFFRLDAPGMRPTV